MIAPKRERLGEAEKKLGEQMEMLEVKQKELQEVTSKLDALRHQFQEKNDMKTYLESQVGCRHIWGGHFGSLHSLINKQFTVIKYLFNDVTLGFA